METIKHAIVREPGANFAQGISSSNLGKPDVQAALFQHRKYCEALESCGVSLIKLPCDFKYPDGCFVEDTAVIVNDHAVITRPGHPDRLGEQVAVEAVLSKHKKISRIEEPGTLDGGDVMRIGKQYFIGLSERTNKKGAEALTEIIRSMNLSAIVMPINGLLHLKTGVTPIGEDTVVCVQELFASFDALSKIVVSESEKHGANCLLVNNTVLMPDDCPELKDNIQRAGKKVIPLPMSEFRKMDGGLSCLSIRF